MLSRVSLVSVLGTTCTALAVGVYISRSANNLRKQGRSLVTTSSTASAEDPAAAPPTASEPRTTSPAAPTLAPAEVTSESSPASEEAALASNQRAAAAEANELVRRQSTSRGDSAEPFLDFKISEHSTTVNLSMERKLRQIALDDYAKSIMTLRSNSSFFASVKATLDVSDWTTDNLRRLAVDFWWLRDQDEERRRFKTLTVELPTTGVAIRNPEPGALSLPSVTTLTWTSHANQLPLLLCPDQYPQRQMSNLAFLTLNGEFSARDCSTILRVFAATLQEFTVDTMTGLFTDPREQSVLRSLNAMVIDGPIQMHALSSLSIVSQFEPGHMLNQFRFPKLEVLKIKTGDGNLRFFDGPGTGFNFINWRNLMVVSIVGNLRSDEFQRIREEECLSCANVACFTA